MDRVKLVDRVKGASELVDNIAGDEECFVEMNSIVNHLETDAGEVSIDDVSEIAIDEANSLNSPKEPIVEAPKLRQPDILKYKDLKGFLLTIPFIDGKGYFNRAKIEMIDIRAARAFVDNNKFLQYRNHDDGSIRIAEFELEGSPEISNKDGELVSTYNRNTNMWENR